MAHRQTHFSLGSPSSWKHGFTMLELLVVMAIVGVLGSIAFISGQQILQKQDAPSTISQFKQIISRGGSVAAARGKEIQLKYLSTRQTPHTT